MNKGCLYWTGIVHVMTDEERIKARAYMFRRQLMIGGCMKTFARRNTLKGYVNNPNLSYIGHMVTYY
jgi:hypothetical protein